MTHEELIKTLRRNEGPLTKEEIEEHVRTCKTCKTQLRLALLLRAIFGISSGTEVETIIALIKLRPRRKKAIDKN